MWRLKDVTPCASAFVPAGATAEKFHIDICMTDHACDQLGSEAAIAIEFLQFWFCIIGPHLLLYLAPHQL